MILRGGILEDTLYFLFKHQKCLEILVEIEERGIDQERTKSKNVNHFKVNLALAHQTNQ